jgi:hypothetical protein
MSTCAQKVRFALTEKGVSWQSRHLDLRRRDRQTPEYLRLNPNAVVPTVVHDGTVNIESTVINEYIDDAFLGPALRPPDAVGRWLASCGGRCGIRRELPGEISRGFGERVRHFGFCLHRRLDLCNVDLCTREVGSGLLLLIFEEKRDSSVTLSESPFYKEPVGRPLCFRERSPKMRSR